MTGPDLASQPTLSRLENRVSRSDLYRLARSLLDTFLASYEKPPKKIIIDIDDPEDITHGAQQLTLFNAYHKEYCYMPVHLYEGHSGRLITAILRRGRRIKGREAAAILRRVFAAIRKAWPKVQITLRGDSHFSTPEVHEVCEAYRLSFILGQAPNSKLHELGASLMEQARAQAEEGAEEEPVRLFSSFDYQAKSWKRPQRILYKAEVTQGKANPRFVTTNIPDRTPKFLYEKVYCATRTGARIHQESQDLPAFGPHLLPSLRGQSIPSFSAQRRLRAHARPSAHRPARHALGDGHLRHDPASRAQSRGARARAGDAHSFSLCDLVSPPGRVEEDPLQL